MGRLAAPILGLLFVCAAPAAQTLVLLGDFALGSGGPLVRSGSLLYRTLYHGYGRPDLQIFDATDPTAPALLSSTPIGDGEGGPGIAAIVVSGWWAYLLTTSTTPGVPGRLHVVDVSNPLAPIEVVDVAVAAEGRDMAGAGSLLYVTDYSPGPGLHVIDVSTPTQPLEVATVPAPDVWGGWSAVDAIGTLAYLGHPKGVAVLDFTTPSAPAFQSFLPFTSPGLLSHDEASGLLFVSTENSGRGPVLDFYDLADPAHPVRLSTTDFGDATAAVSGDRAILSSCTILDIADPRAPRKINQCSFASGTAVVDGDVALFSDGAIVDLSLPQFPATLATIAPAPGGVALGLDVDGSRAYVAEGAAGLRVVDVSNPAAPATIAVIDTPGGARDVDVRNGLAYVADGPAGLRIVDIAASPPRLRGGFATPQQAAGVAVVGTRAYVALGPAGVAVFDVSNPDAPFPVAALPTTDAKRVDAQGARLLVADGAGGLRIYDLANPAAPVLRGTAPLPDARDVAHSGSLAYVADRAQGLVVVDLSDASAPVVLSDFHGPIQSNAVAVAGDFAQIASDFFGEEAIEVTDPANPVKRGGTTGGATGLAVRGTVVFSSGADGFRVVDLGPEYDPGPARCGVAMDATRYATGDVLRLATLAFANPRTSAQPARLRVQLALPNGATVELIDAGAAGGLALPGSFDVDLGPVPLFAVPASLPRGAYELRCSVADSASGAVLGADAASFEVE